MASSKAKPPQIVEEPDPFKGEALPEKGPETVPEKPAGRQPIAKADPPATPGPGRLAYRVWECGTLQRSGKVYEPGAVIYLSPEEAAKIPCLSPAK